MANSSVQGDRRRGTSPDAIVLEQSQCNWRREQNEQRTWPDRVFVCGLLEHETLLERADEIG